MKKKHCHAKNHYEHCRFQHDGADDYEAEIDEENYHERDEK